MRWGTSGARCCVTPAAAHIPRADAAQPAAFRLWKRFQYARFAAISAGVFTVLAKGRTHGLAWLADGARSCVKRLETETQ